MNKSRFCAAPVLLAVLVGSSSLTSAGERLVGRREAHVTRTAPAGEEKTAFFGLFGGRGCGVFGNCGQGNYGSGGCGYGSCARRCGAPCGAGGCYPRPVCQPGYPSYGGYYGRPAPVYSQPIYGVPGYGAPQYGVPYYGIGMGRPIVPMSAAPLSGRSPGYASPALLDDSPFYP